MKRMLVIRICLFLIGIIGVWWFFLPFMNRRILNIGNGTGMIVSVLFLLGGLFLSGWTDFGKKMYLAGGISKASLLGVGFLAGVIFLLAGVTSAKMYFGSKVSPKEDATVIVLGCKVYGTRPSLMLRERLDAAYVYLKENPRSNCIVSGGQGEGEEITEAEAMKVYLMEKGVEENRIFKEEKSRNTRENLLFSNEILKEKGMNEDLAIATNEFHLYRARKIAKNLGLEAGAVSGKTAWWLFPTYYVREMYSILYEWVR